MKKQHRLELLKALLVMVLWGSLFPLVKIGYRAMQVNTASPADILMFAGVRFAVCGLIISLFAWKRGEKISWDVKTSLYPLAMMGLFAVVFHYACTYIGLTMTDSSKTAILKQTGALLYICFSFLFIPEEKFRVCKLLGALLGFGGILVINAGNGIGFSLGDGLILLASVCTVVSNLYSKRAMQVNSSIASTGVSQLFGGVLLMAAAFAMGGKLPVFSWASLPVFVCICLASIFGYCIWFSVVRTGELSHLFIVKFSEPIFAAIFGALLLQEDILRWQYAAAFVLISAGILVSHASAEKRG